MTPLLLGAVIGAFTSLTFCLPLHLRDRAEITRLRSKVSDEQDMTVEVFAKMFRGDPQVFGMAVA